MASGVSVSKAINHVVLNHIIFWVLKVRLYDADVMFESVARMTLRATRASGMSFVNYGFSLQYIDPYGVPYRLSDTEIGEDNIDQVCYQMLHIPSGLLSPIYDHEYVKVAPSTKGMPIDLGKVKMFPVTKVWPELAEHVTGNLPQLIQ